MKLSRIASILAGVGILAGAQVALASDGTITFTGNITATTCEVNGGTGSFSVALPTVSTSQLGSVGATAGWTGFSIALTNCAGGTLNTAVAHFEGGSNVDANGRLNLDAGGAQGVQLALREPSASAHIAVGAASQGTTPVNISSGSATLRYEAGYYANSGTVVAGAANSSVVYTIAYQ